MHIAIQKPAGIRVAHLDQMLVCSLFVSYSLLSRPIPQSAGVGELILVTLLGLFMARMAVMRVRSSGIAEGQERPLSSLLAYLWLFLVPTMMGIGVFQHSFSNYARDAVPLMFIALPFLLFPRSRINPQFWLELLTSVFVISGTILTLRYIFTSQGVAFRDILITDGAPLNQCSTVIFTAAAGPFLALQEHRPRLMRLLALAGAMLCFGGLAMSVMRAQMALVLIAWLVGALLVFPRLRTKTRLLIFTLPFLAIAVFGDFFNGAYQWPMDMVRAKTDATGLLNNRDQELRVVADLFWSDMGPALFGYGWGASMYIPTAGGVVRYTHNSILFLIWKSGVLGCLAMAVYVFYTCRLRALAKFALSSMKDDIGVILGLVCALVTFGIIEMGYKMMSFGFLLCIVQALLFKIEKTNRFAPQALQGPR